MSWKIQPKQKSKSYKNNDDKIAERETRIHHSPKALHARIPLHTRTRSYEKKNNNIWILLLTYFGMHKNITRKNKYNIYPKYKVNGI